MNTSPLEDFPQFHIDNGRKMSIKVLIDKSLMFQSPVVQSLSEMLGCRSIEQNSVLEIHPVEGRAASFISYY